MCTGLLFLIITKHFLYIITILEIVFSLSNQLFQLIWIWILQDHSTVWQLTRFIGPKTSQEPILLKTREKTDWKPIKIQIFKMLNQKLPNFFNRTKLIKYRNGLSW
jgi:hypothetical protein